MICGGMDEMPADGRKPHDRLDWDGQKPNDKCISMSDILQQQHRHQQRIEELLRQQEVTILQLIRGMSGEWASRRRSRSGSCQSGLRSLCGDTPEFPSEPPSASGVQPAEASLPLERPSTQASCPSLDDMESPQRSSLRQAVGSRLSGQTRSSKVRPSVIIKPFEDKEQMIRSATQANWEPDSATPGRLGSKVRISCIRKAAMKVILHRSFEPSMVLMIVGNSVVIGMQADWGVKQLFDTPPMAFVVLDIAFSVIFLIELCLRFTADGASFLSPYHKTFGWNIFDTLIVMSAMVDQVMQRWVNAPGVLAMRLLRLLRIAKVLRVIRVFRFFQDLRILLAGMVASMKSLFWVILLSTVLAFLAGVCIMDFVAEKLRQPDVDNQLATELMKYYGSVANTLFSMYQAVTNGIDWGNMADPLLEVHPLLCVLFSFYIAVVVICILNMITGLYVENAKRLTQHDETQVLMETVQTRKEWLDEVKTLFVRVANPVTKRMDLPSFVEHLGDMRVQINFKKLGIEVEQENAGGLFEMLDLQGDGFVDLDEFALGIQMLHGSARSIDMARLRFLVMGLDKQMTGLVAEMETAKLEAEDMSAAPSIESSV